MKAWNIRFIFQSESFDLIKLIRISDLRYQLCEWSEGQNGLSESAALSHTNSILVHKTGNWKGMKTALFWQVLTELKCAYRLLYHKNSCLQKRQRTYCKVWKCTVFIYHTWSYLHQSQLKTSAWWAGTTIGSLGAFVSQILKVWSPGIEALINNSLQETFGVSY